MSGRVDWRGTQVSANVRRAVEAALPGIAEQVLTLSKREVPVETGTLMRSGTVTMTNGGRTAEISYNTPYAAYQHEGVDLVHPNGGKAKYLEDPLRASAPKVIEALARAAKKGLHS